MTRPIRKCKWCGNLFGARSKTQIYCNQRCSKQALEDLKLKRAQLCYVCQRADSENKGCPWIADLIPVKGWKATPTTVKCNNGEVYISNKIEECPLFIHDNDEVK